MVRQRQSGVETAPVARRRGADDDLLQRFTLQPRITLSTTPHTEPWHEFHIIVAGSGDFRFKGGRLHCRPGDCFYTTAGTVHSMRAADPGYVLQYVAWLPVDGDLDRDLRARFPAGRIRHLGLDQIPLVRALAELHGRGDAFARRAATRRFIALLYRLMADEPVPSPVPAAVAAMLAMIHAALRRPLRLDEVASAAGLEATSAVRAFRRHLGQPPVAYHAALRMDLAAELLGQAASVAEVAHAVGFEDPFHFSRAFRARFGRPPSAVLGRDPAATVD